MDEAQLALFEHYKTRKGEIKAAEAELLNSYLEFVKTGGRQEISLNLAGQATTYTTTDIPTLKGMIRNLRDIINAIEEWEINPAFSPTRKSNARYA